MLCPRYCDCGPPPGLPGGCDRTGTSGCAPPNTGPKLGPLWGGCWSHCGTGHLSGGHAGLDCCLSAAGVSPYTTSLPPRKSSGLLCSQYSLGPGTPCGWLGAKERPVKRQGGLNCLRTGCLGCWCRGGVEAVGLTIGRAALHSPGLPSGLTLTIEPLPPYSPPLLHQPHTPADTGCGCGGCWGPEPLAFDTGD